MKFYSSVRCKGNKIYERGYENGHAFKRSFNYKPYLFVSSPIESIYKTIHGEYVSKLEFNSISEAKDFLYRYKDVENYNIYGFTNFEYVYIYDNYPKNFEYDYNLLNVINFDIETDSSGSFPNIKEADKEINAITLAKRKKTVTFGFFDYVSTENNLYVKCKNEEELLKQFVIFWNKKEWLPDIISGWNIEFFDIPYIYNRIKRVLGEEWANKLSPFDIVQERVVHARNGKEIQTYDIFGIAIVDYYAAYKKFATNERENYKLDYIAELEIGEKKIDYSEYGSLDKLYKQNPQLYYKYNCRDSTLIDGIENKLHYIEQIVNIAYIERVNFENTLKTVKPWDVLIHNYLMDNYIVVPQYDKEESTYRIMGGFVKEPKPGKYENVVTFDFISLYPSEDIQYNISPDTFVKQFSKKIKLDKIFNDDISEFTKELKRRNLTMTANGCLFKRDKRGFLPSLMKEFFDERKRVRVLEAEAKKAYEISKTNENRNIMLKYKNLQTAYKLINNSGFGAVANVYFRWFANHIAEAITSSGQMTIQYVEIKVNEFLNELFKTKNQDYVVYMDTDSCYITLDNYIKQQEIIDIKEKVKALVDFSENTLSPYIDKICKDLADKLNAFEFKTLMKIEKVCDQTFFLGKKHYALNVYYDEGIYYDMPKLKVTGLETVRSSIPKKVRNKLEDCYKIIFDNDKVKLSKTIDEFKHEFNNMTFEEIGKPSGVKGIAKYYDPITLVKSHCPIHVRASIVYNDFIKKNKLENQYQPIEDYDKVKYCYLTLPNPTFQNVIAIKNDEVPKELDINEFLDYKTQYEKLFLGPIESVCNAIGWNSKNIETFDEIFTKD